MLRKKIVRWTIFADVATSDSEAIGALRRKIPITCSIKETSFVCQDKRGFFLHFGRKTGKIQ